MSSWSNDSTVVVDFGHPDVRVEVEPDAYVG
jgi:hypothetical protein